MPNSASDSTSACVLSAEKLGLELDAEQAACAGEVALPDRVTRRARQARMQHLLHLGPPAQPVRHLDRGIHLLRQSHAQRAHAAQCQPAIVRTGILSQPARRRVQPLPVLGRVHGDAADQNVRVPGRILCRCLDRHIDAVFERLEVMDAPGVVHQHFRTPRMRRTRDRGNILHFKSVAARTLGINDLGVRPHQVGNPRLVDHRIVERGLNAKALQEALGEVARRAVHRIRHQAMLARIQERQQRRGHRSQSRTYDGAARAAFDLGDHVLERPMRLGPAQPVAQHTFAAPRRHGTPFRNRRIQHGRAAQQRRIDEAVRVLAGAPGVRQSRPEPALGGLGHGRCVSTGVSGRPPHSVQEPS
jgi:hypothetical protein